MSQPDAIRVAYLGPEASFSHQAAIELFSAQDTDGNTDESKPRVTLDPLPSFTSIFTSVQQCSSASSASTTHHYDYAVIPIENSTNGSVVQVFDLLGQCGLDDGNHEDKKPTDAAALYPDLQVCAEYYLPVHHCLFVHPSQSAHCSSSASPSSTTPEFPPISTIYTHPQVWGQCGRFLSKHFPAGVVERIDLGSTSAAASLVAREGGASAGAGTAAAISTTDDPATSTTATIAAISSRLAGHKHNLLCLAENIEDSPGDNTTRFLVLRNTRLQPRRPAHHRALVSRFHHVDVPSNEHEHETDHHGARGGRGGQRRRHKSLITFTIPHTKPGSLADALAVFKTHGFNLTSIDTRPSRRRNWHYVFFVECEEAEAEAGAGAEAGNNTRHGQRGEEEEEGERGGDNDDDNDDGDLGGNLTCVLGGLAKYTESLRYLGRFVDQLQKSGDE